MVDDALATHLAPGEIIIDGGNSHDRDDIRRATPLAPACLDHVDSGTRGGHVERQDGDSI
jgi:6-phosphogluconate dehydrogenase